MWRHSAEKVKGAAAKALAVLTGIWRSCMCLAGRGEGMHASRQSRQRKPPATLFKPSTSIALRMHYQRIPWAVKELLIWGLLPVSVPPHCGVAATSRVGGGQAVAAQAEHLMGHRAAGCAQRPTSLICPQAGCSNCSAVAAALLLRNKRTARPLPGRAKCPHWDWDSPRVHAAACHPFCRVRAAPITPIKQTTSCAAVCQGAELALACCAP